MSARQWTRDLGLGVRFAFTGGREGWGRVLLTAVGVGLGVALLLLTTAIPSALAARGDRESARTNIMYVDTQMPKADNTLLVAMADTNFRADDIRGRALEAEGPRAPLPPGVDKLPAAGEMVVSPALERLLKSGDGKLLRERLPDRIVGTIDDNGLRGPAELAFYRGADNLAEHLTNGVNARINRFGDLESSSEGMDPVLLLLTLVVFVVLLMPVGVFIATAVRFGGERRDRRLAALRLVGADGMMTRRIAAGEAFAGAAVGLVLGAVFFLIGRQAAGYVEILDMSVFPSDLNPAPALAVLVGVAVPVAAVLVTLFALRGVVIEPLGVVRTARPPRRRLWWRLLMPLGGIAALSPMIGQGNDAGQFNDLLVITGVTLLLVGVTALLPWVVEATVARLGSGGLSWQLAVRRLQLSSGTAARMVNGIAVAVAGAIALQMFFAGVSGAYTTASDQDLDRAQMEFSVPDNVSPASAAQKLTSTKGVRKITVISSASVGDKAKDPENSVELTIGDCATLREMGHLPSCRDGDAFTVRGAEYDTVTPRMVKPGRELWISSDRALATTKPSDAWTVPAGLKQAGVREDPSGVEHGGILATPGALPKETVAEAAGRIFIGLDPEVADAHDLVRNTAARIDPLTAPDTWTSSDRTKQFNSIRTGLFVGATCVLLLIGVSLLVSQLEQLRERRKLLSSLVAFGTRRRTLSLSVLWQTAIPIGLGLMLSSVVGLTLGVVLLKMTSRSVHVDWAAVLAMTGIGAGVVLLVTLLSLPPLLRLMRAEGLRTE
ncbi:ABC transporter permease [Streptomyces sp. NBC_00576]|uniref:ABC transporter permease n=1 Tax=Streptomyces sp. NBC_00576 TaxID=2903665 RepID=UPI002E814CC0|nr:FtsX-like permease family protein [Streptomyces sp. NBC_00576]WUB71353.1 ABC transporter permease [Streptomyces sp. NBC_00576]